jgi:hypothetical protein
VCAPAGADDEPPPAAEAGAEEPALDAGGGVPATAAEPAGDVPPEAEPPDDEQLTSVAAPRARIADHANSREGIVFTALISFHGARGCRDYR